MLKKNLLFFIGVIVCASGEHDHRVHVDVYYESLCPDSIKFITKQLYPAINSAEIVKFVNLTLVPYGKSNQSINVNQYEFTCHHGPDECKGNKIQACALAMSDSVDEFGVNRNTFNFINCLMEKVDRSSKPVNFPIQDCGTQFQIRNVLDIENCAGHADGNTYLAKLGNKTQEFQSPLKSVPTIVFNGKYKAEDNTAAQNNFTKAVCQYIHAEHRPAACNFAVMVSASIVALAASAFSYVF